MRHGQSAGQVLLRRLRDPARAEPRNATAQSPSSSLGTVDIAISAEATAAADGERKTAVFAKRSSNLGWATTSCRNPAQRGQRPVSQSSLIAPKNLTSIFSP
jgi:hypothetical protein